MEWAKSFLWQPQQSAHTPQPWTCMESLVEQEEEEYLAKLFFRSCLGLIQDKNALKRLHRLRD